MNLKEVVSEIDEMIYMEKEDLEEAIRLARNSFGHGYSEGRISTLAEIKDMLLKCGSYRGAPFNYLNKDNRRVNGIEAIQRKNARMLFIEKWGRKIKSVVNLAEIMQDAGFYSPKTNRADIERLLEKRVKAL